MQVPGPGRANLSAIVMMGKMEKRKRGVIHLNRVFSFQAQAMKGGPID